MVDQRTADSGEGLGISLVDGNAAVRRARQIMLLSRKYDVRSYATCRALLDDPRSRDYPCIILDVAGEDIDGREVAEGARGPRVVDQHSIARVDGHRDRAHRESPAEVELDAAVGHSHRQPRRLHRERRAPSARADDGDPTHP